MTRIDRKVKNGGNNAHFVIITFCLSLLMFLLINGCTNPPKIFLVPPQIALAFPANGATNQATSLILTWEATPGSIQNSGQRTTAINGYNVYAYKSGEISRNPLWVTEKQASQTNLEYGQGYRWYVVAVQADGQTATSTEWTFTTVEKQYAAPRVILTNPSDKATNQATDMTFSWIGTPGVQTNSISRESTTMLAYHLYVGKVSEAWPEPISTTQTSMRLQLDHETGYRWQVVAFQSDGQTATSSQNTFTTADRRYSSPQITLLYPANGAKDRPTDITFTWNASAGQTESRAVTLTGFNFYLAKESEDYSLPVYIEGGTNQQKHITNLEHGTSYKWRVDVIQSDGKVTNSAEWRFTTASLLYFITAQSSPTEGGEVRIAAGDWGDIRTAPIADGNNATVEASETTGWSFEGWYEGANQVSSSATYTFTVTGIRTLKANFVRKQYTITAQSSPTEGGEVRIDDGEWGDDQSTTAVYEDQITLEASAVFGWSFEGWYEDENLVSTSMQYSFPATKNHTLKAKFLRGNPMVLIEGGLFFMGDALGDHYMLSNAHPINWVNLTYDFWMGKYEVTFDEYDAYCEDMGLTKPDDRGMGRGRRPVINVSWFDAIKFCNWLSLQNGLIPAYDETTSELLDKNGNVTMDIRKVEGYRLPTEAEWEYAARGGKYTHGYLHAGSNNLNEVGWYVSNSGGISHSVGEKRPNELGLYDMSGNLWEMCYDSGNERSYGKMGSRTDPIYIEEGNENFTSRGGGYASTVALYCRITFRTLPPKNQPHVGRGFRVVKTEPVPPGIYRITAQASPIGVGEVRVNESTWGEHRSAVAVEGDEVTVETTEVFEESFEGWYEDGNLVSTSMQFSFMATCDRDLRAKFKLTPTYIMGNTRDDPEGLPNEKPVHGVIFTYDFWISPYELTFDEYDAFCDETGTPKPTDYYGWGRGTRPVIGVEWRFAIRYCNWLSIRNGLAPAYKIYFDGEFRSELLDKNGNVTTDISKVEGYRLPTEAEWEYAARGGNIDIVNGNEANDYKYAGSDNLDDFGWYAGNSEGQTHPVGQKLPNELGLYDMSGNAEEWCYDDNNPPETPYSSATQIDFLVRYPNGYYIIRGGAWRYEMDVARVAGRGTRYSGVSSYGIGFRLARTLF